jgi:hypothetical protein
MSPRQTTGEGLPYPIFTEGRKTPWSAIADVLVVADDVGGDSTWWLPMPDVPDPLLRSTLLRQRSLLAEELLTGSELTGSGHSGDRCDQKLPMPLYLAKSVRSSLAISLRMPDRIWGN